MDLRGGIDSGDQMVVMLRMKPMVDKPPEMR